MALDGGRNLRADSDRLAAQMEPGGYAAPMAATGVVLMIGVGAYVFLVRENVPISRSLPGNFLPTHPVKTSEASHRSICLAQRLAQGGVVIRQSSRRRSILIPEVGTRMTARPLLILRRMTTPLLYDPEEARGTLAAPRVPSTASHFITSFLLVLVIAALAWYGYPILKRHDASLKDLAGVCLRR